MPTTNSDQEERWAREREACWERFLWRVVAWLQIDDPAEKRKAFRQCAEEFGEISAKSTADMVARLKEAGFDRKRDPASELPALTPEEQQAYIRKLLR